MSRLERADLPAGEFGREIGRQGLAARFGDFQIVPRANGFECHLGRVGIVDGRCVIGSDLLRPAMDEIKRIRLGLDGGINARAIICQEGL